MATPVWIITVGHRTFAVQMLCMTVHCAVDRMVWPVNAYMHTHTCTLARLGLRVMSGVVWNGTWSLTTCMRWRRNDRLVLPPLPLKIRWRGRFLCLPIRSGRLTTSRSIRCFLGCGVMSTNLINHSLDCCGVLSVGDSRREYVESRTSRTSGLPDRTTTSIAMS